jgi:hypothetical protein
MKNADFSDPAKSRVGALTMAYQDYFFVEKWYDYYGGLFGPENLFLISHGGDPKHLEIAKNANVITVPRDPTLSRLERRRWASISSFSAALLEYYNWLICGDVDEIVVPDPDVFPDLNAYFAELNSQKRRPKSLCPLGLELIHNPDHEPDKLDPKETILSQRRVFRINPNYSKPCILRQKCTFTIGGHANTHLPRVLADDLYLIHMRYFDYDYSYQRLVSRAQMRRTMNNAVEGETVSGAWADDLASLKSLSSGLPVRTTVDFPDFRKTMVDRQQLLHDGKVAFWGGRRTKELYQLPERFGAVF